MPSPAPRAVAPPPEAAAPDPVRIIIPAIVVDAPIVPLGLDDVGALEVPEDFASTGWFRGGSEPGESGAAVIAGHVDSYDGPAVFSRLPELEPGDKVIIERADGSRRTFVVHDAQQWPKDKFPTDLVYRSSDTAELRLITCGGDFDRAESSYRDNLVVFADAAAVQ